MTLAARADEKRAAGYIFAVSLLGLVLSHADQSLFGYAIPGIRAEFKLSLEAIGMILTVSFAAAALASIVAGVAADRFGRRLVFTFCLAMSSLIVALHYFVQNAITLAVLRTLAFSLAAPLGAIGTTYTVEAVTPRRRGIVTGLLQCAYPLGWFIASLIAAPVLGAYGWRALFAVAVIIVPMALMFRWLLPESQRFMTLSRIHDDTADASGLAQRSRWSESLRTLLAPSLVRRTIAGFTLFLLYGGAYAGTAFFFPTYFQEHLGYSEASAARIVGLSYGIGLVGYLASALVGEYLLSRRNTIATWLLAGAASFGGLIWIADDKQGHILWFGVVAAFFYGVSAVQWAFAAELFPTRARATGTSVMLSGMLIGFAVFPGLVAWLIREVGWAVAFTLAVVPSLVAAAGAVLMIESHRSGLELEEIAA